MSRALNDVAAGTLFGVALNYKGLLDSRLPEFQQPPYQKPPVKPVLFIKTPNTRNEHDAILYSVIIIWRLSHNSYFCVIQLFKTLAIILTSFIAHSKDLFPPSM